ncbi:hypothetical protein DVH24_001879 [Malus domestica]|uniref:Ubiquitin-like domain-containing protein n=1 Tax=Malus domestica TaxID=3750 RepID=A0A498I9Y5_MALDO|nr:hypothetical protein DVH24_001879 [Malus domestica]
MRTVALKVKRSETMKESTELFLGGDMLMDCRSIVECGVQRDSTLRLILQNNVGSYLSNYHQVRAPLRLKQKNEEDSTLDSLGIKDKSTLQVILAPKDNLSISVKAPSGQTIKLKVKALFTVSDVKNIVGNITGISMIIGNGSGHITR